MIVRQKSRNTFIIKGQKITVTYGDVEPLPLTRALTTYFVKFNPQLTPDQVCRRMLFWQRAHNLMIWRAHWHKHPRKRITGFPRSFKIKLI